ncbi:DUF6114 domain-containing protein [Sphaerisporangium perillae]|uniref:DUF6114 domain-containing protein n=1 Tax=Sphaerisporangium perillae TaxID=2935860 RepID=UPI00200F0C43|nr:DUF6114 domain-containing protein [Sphaerisporangium perillae]
MKSWRRSRPFWGGLIIVVAGVELLSIPFTLDAITLIIRSPQAGLTYLLSITMIMVGLLILFQPAQRVFLGVVAILLSIMSVIYANIGGFLIGMILGLLGGALTAAWTPIPEADPPAGAPADRHELPADGHAAMGES